MADEVREHSNGEASIPAATGRGRPDFPTRRPAQEALDNSSCTEDQPEEFCDDGFVTRSRADGSALAFSTVVVAGSTDSCNFPTRAPVQAALGGNVDGLVAALPGRNAPLAWSTFLGGTDADRANAFLVSLTSRPRDAD